MGSKMLLFEKTDIKRGNILASHLAHEAKMPLVKPKPVVCMSRKQGRGINELKANLAEKKEVEYVGGESASNGQSIYEAKYEL